MKTALVDSVGTAVYILAVISFMNYASSIGWGKNNQIFVPIAMLMLLVLSASVTGYLMVGRPALMYFDGKKKEALALFIYTLIAFAIITVTALSAVVFMTG